MASSLRRQPWQSGTQLPPASLNRKSDSNTRSHPSGLLVKPIQFLALEMHPEGTNEIRFVPNRLAGVNRRKAELAASCDSWTRPSPSLDRTACPAPGQRPSILPAWALTFWSRLPRGLRCRPPPGGGSSVPTHSTASRAYLLLVAGSVPVSPGLACHHLGRR